MKTQKTPVMEGPVFVETHKINLGHVLCLKIFLEQFETFWPDMREEYDADFIPPGNSIWTVDIQEPTWA